MKPRFLVFILALSVATIASAATVSPSNLPAGFCNDVVAGDLSVSGAFAIDTSTACTLVQPQVGGPDLCVVRFNNVSVGPAGQINVSGPRALALTAQGTFLVQGVVAAGFGGGGGFAIGSGATNAAAGGGGAGGDFTGGVGGASASGLGGAGGPFSANVRLVPLLSGADGGNGAGGAIAGKGAVGLELVSCGTFTLAAGARISSSGGGGAGGATGGNGGGGGGSGGGILIEGDSVTIAGGVTANGGGGGGGGGTTTAGNPGAAGGTGVTRASGGNGGSSGGGTGGLGGAGGVAPNGGTTASGAGTGGGGGGGSTGIIRVNACSAQSTAGALFSPAASSGSSCLAIFADSFEG